MTDTLALARTLLAGALSDDGGATVSPTGESIPTTGYFVGGIVPEYSAPADILTVRRVRDFVDLYQSQTFLGSWAQDDRLVFDVSDWHPTFLSAMLAARERGEDAVYDIVNQTSITV